MYENDLKIPLHFDIEMWSSLENRTFAEMAAFDSIYIGGGNTFTLLDILHNTNFIKILRQFIDTGRVVYGGSAGAIIFGKDIRTAGLGKDADKNTTDLQTFDGLDLVEGFSIQCHYEKNQEKELHQFPHSMRCLSLRYLKKQRRVC